MSPKKKDWVTPTVSDRIFERGWNRETLLQVQGLVRRAVDLIRANGNTPEAMVRLDSVLVDIEAELARTQIEPIE